MAPRSGPEYPFPVDDYAAAKRWLWTKGRVHEWLDSEPDDLPPVAVLICDMFWINPAKLLRDLRRDWDATAYMFPAPRPCPRGRRPWGRR